MTREETVQTAMDLLGTVWLQDTQMVQDVKVLMNSYYEKGMTAQQIANQVRRVLQIR